MKVALFIIFAFLAYFSLHSQESTKYIVELSVSSSEQRTQLLNEGVDILHVEDEVTLALMNEQEIETYADLIISRREVGPFLQSFPRGDEDFHTYEELTNRLQEMAQKYPNWVTLTSVGQTHEGRDIWAVRLSLSTEEMPAVVFMGGHHAREHLSIEVPLRTLDKLIEKLEAGDQEIVTLLSQRVAYFVPMVNPDGAEYDIEGGRYKMWRKNRILNEGGTFGVDLNRNYGYQWNTGGSSSRPSSDVYHGPHAFSENESTAIKDFVGGLPSVAILLSYHTFSELILYPWGHTYDNIADQEDYLVHRTMAEQMARWNNYRPQQSSDLYIASGDTTDWSYGELGIISFTFELDPKSQWEGGFYPGAALIDSVVEKNFEPALYLLEFADNPKRVLN